MRAIDMTDAVFVIALTFLRLVLCQIHEVFFQKLSMFFLNNDLAPNNDHYLAVL